MAVQKNKNGGCYFRRNKGVAHDFNALALAAAPDSVPVKAAAART